MLSMNKEVWDVAVIGGGPAGMISAGRSAELGAKVILIEKNESLGKKLLITGNGRCNVTNAESDTRVLLDKFKENGKFLFSAFSQFSVKETLDFFNSKGMPTKIENEKRVFPESNSSSSVLNVLLTYMKAGNVKILTNSPVASVIPAEAGELGNGPERKDGGGRAESWSGDFSAEKYSGLQSENMNLDPRIREDDKQPKNINSGTNKKITSIVLENGEEIFAKSFIIATGGKSYPKTGSTGDGFVWLKKLGHTIIKPDSALVPINIKESWVKELQGVTLPEIKISILEDDKKVETKLGKILFTHFGVSGPTILNMSRKINEIIPNGDVFITLDLLPKFDFSSLNEELQKIFKKHTNKKFRNAILDLIPSGLVEIVIKKSDINGDTFCHSVTRDERIKLMHVLKDIRMQIESLQSPENAIVASGGVALEEVDFKTMQSKLFPNLYLTGDILNINRPSGGYSLQICWTTGYVAGTNASGK
jgi:predicted Rossmann fold flavoprotein